MRGAELAQGLVAGGANGGLACLPFLHDTVGTKRDLAACAIPFGWNVRMIFTIVVVRHDIPHKKSVGILGGSGLARNQTISDIHACSSGGRLRGFRSPA